MSNKAINQLVFLAIFVLLAWAFFHYSQTEEDEPIVREYSMCIRSVCKTVEGAGEVCVFQQPPVIVKVKIIKESEGQTIRFTPTLDRCDDGSN